MDGIADWIRKLKREVESALSDSGPLPLGARLEANRVTLTLALPPLAGAPAQAQPGNQLTIEFHVHLPEAGETVRAASPETPAVQVAPETVRSLILETGTAVFGPGGFDNSARAEVFCELVSGMEPADVVAALGIVEGRSAGVATAALAYPVTRLRQMLGFSALGSEIAAGRLRELIERTSVLALVTILGEEWRFGTHWSQPSSEA